MAEKKSKRKLQNDIKSKDLIRFYNEECDVSVLGSYYNDPLEDDDFYFNYVEYSYLPEEMQVYKSGRFIDMDSIYSKEVKRKKIIDEILNRN